MADRYVRQGAPHDNRNASGTTRSIETRYNGYRFRSRLEARWAVFLDALSIEYEYEKEGFDTPEGPYLPDFWLLRQETWFEVKHENTASDDYEIAICKLFHVTPDSCSSIIVRGSPRYYDAVEVIKLRSQKRMMYAVDALMLTYSGDLVVFPTNDNQKEITAAVKAASHARFEHGETPRVRASA